MSESKGREYTITPRPVDLGGGWKLTLLEDGEEAGGGVFPVPGENPEKGMTWWNSLPKDERMYWLIKAASAIPADARHAYLLSVAYDDALDTGENWSTP